MIREFLSAPRPSFSFEIFPPKGSSDLAGTWATVDALASLTPDLISVTYGAGGSSRDNTVEIASAIQNQYSIDSVAHLTCAGATKLHMDNLLQELQEKGVRNILALRGDLKDATELSEFRYASDLIAYIKEHHNFRILAACYPEKHIESPSMDDDLRHLKHKVDCGVNVLVSQLFFDNDHFFNFVTRIRELGIQVPVVAGVMPVTSAAQIEKMVSLCGATVPPRVQRFVQAYGHNSMAMREAGVAYATNQIIDLLGRGVDGIHIYSMNQADITRRIVENLRGVLYSLRVKRN